MYPEMRPVVGYAVTAVNGNATAAFRGQGAQPFRCDPVLHDLRVLRRAVEHDDRVAAAHGTAVAVDVREGEHADLVLSGDHLHVRCLDSARNEIHGRDNLTRDAIVDT